MPPKSILHNCSQFLRESEGKPLYRLLNSSGDGFRRIKIRKKNRHEFELEKYFDKAFSHEYKDVRLRSVIAHTSPPAQEDPSREPFYIFPTDGYKALFNRQVSDYVEYIKELQLSIDGCGNPDQLMEMLFSYAYVSTDNIQEAMLPNSTILIYGIQDYYAVRVSLVEDYNNFINY